MAVLAWVFHAQVDRRRRERARQGEDVRVRSDDLLLRVFERLFKRRAGLEPHAAGDARLARADDVDGAGVHLRNVAAGHHREAVERVERIGEAILAGCIPRSSRNTRRSGSYPAGSACSRAGTFHTVLAGTASARRGNSRRRCSTR